MKKVLIFALSIIMALGCFGLVSCGSDKIVIGAQNGTTGYYYITGDEGFGFEGLKNAKVAGYSNGALAVQDMLNGNIDFVIIDEAPALQMAKTIDGIKVIEVALTEEEYAFGVDKNNSDLLTQINAIIAEITTDGKEGTPSTFESIVKKYFAEESDGIVGIESATKDPEKADTQLVVATNAAFAPFEYKLGNKFAGIDMEIAKVIADKLEMELVIEDMDFDAVVTSVGNNYIDVAMAGLTVNEQRKESVNFTTSYYTANQVIIVKENDKTFDGLTTEAQIVEKLNSLKK